MDFVSDALFDGQRLRALTVVDAYTREALPIDVDQGIKVEQVDASKNRWRLRLPCDSLPLLASGGGDGGTAGFL